MIEGYLADKWDLNDSLPEGHSYRDFANFPYPNFGLSLEDNGSLKPEVYSIMRSVIKISV